MAYQLAQAYVQIVPSMKGVGKAIESAFDGPSKSVGQKAGDTAGGGFSRGFSAKLGVISGTKHADLHDIDLLITDTSVTDEQCAQLERAGMRVQRT